MKTFAERLKWSRADAEMTLQQVADKSQHSVTMLHRMERGNIKGTTRIFILADALGVDARWLQTGEGEPK